MEGAITVFRRCGCNSTLHPIVADTTGPANNQPHVMGATFPEHQLWQMLLPYGTTEVCARCAAECLTGERARL